MKLATNKAITGHHPVQVKSEHPIQRVIRLVEEPMEEIWGGVAPLRHGWVKPFCPGRQIRRNPENYQMGYHIITRYDQTRYYQIWPTRIVISGQFSPETCDFRLWFRPGFFCGRSMVTYLSRAWFIYIMGIPTVIGSVNGMIYRIPCFLGNNLGFQGLSFRTFSPLSKFVIYLNKPAFVGGWEPFERNSQASR